MLALIEETGNNERTTIISSDTDDRLKFQIEKLLNSQIGATTWAKLYVDMETVDLGRFQITLFETNSILSLKVKSQTTVFLDVQRNVHALSKG